MNNSRCNCSTAVGSVQHFNNCQHCNATLSMIESDLLQKPTCLVAYERFIEQCYVSAMQSYDNQDPLVVHGYYGSQEGATSMATPAMCMTSRTTRKVMTEGRPCRQGSQERSPSRHTLHGRVPEKKATIVLGQITWCGCVPMSGPTTLRCLQACSAAPGSVTQKQQCCTCRSVAGIGWP